MSIDNDGTPGPGLMGKQRAFLSCFDLLFQF